MDLKESLIEKIRNVVPNKQTIIDKSQDIADHLVDQLGLEDLNQLDMVKETDLTQVLSLFAARELIRALCNAGVPVQNNGENGQEGDSENNSGRSEESGGENGRPVNRRRTRQQSRNNRRERDWDFDIEWSDLYNISPTLKSRMTKGKKLTNTVKKEIVTRLVSQVRQRVPGVKRSIFRQVTMDLKEKYKVTFRGELAGGKVSKLSLCKRMQDQFDNIHRKKNRKTATESEAPATKAAYGCVKWRLSSLPNGETVESLQNIQVNLRDHYEQVRPRAWNGEMIMEGMATTFGEQRNDINKQTAEIEKALKAQKKRKKNNGPVEPPVELPLTANIRDKWPFLFQSRCMLAHFEKLTGVNITAKINIFLSNDLKDIIKFLLETSKGKTKKLKKRLRRCELPGQNARLAALVHLLCDRFQEDRDGIFIMVDETATEDDLPELCDLPKTPRLVIAGEHLFQYERLFFVMDKEVLGVASDLVEGIGLLFAAYYVFNIVYEPTVQTTLEFFQRCVAEIDPGRGHKRANRETALAAGVSFVSQSTLPAISRLDDKYTEFFASDSEGDDTDQAENEGLAD